MVTKGERGWGRINNEFGISRYKLLHIKWIKNKVLLYSTGNYIHYLVINHNGRECGKEYTVSSLHTILQVVNFQRCECAFACPVTIVHMSGVHCHMHASSKSSYAFVHFTVQYCIEYSSTVSSFQPQDVRKQA